MGFGEFNMSYTDLGEAIGLEHGDIAFIQHHGNKNVRIVIESPLIQGGLSYAPKKLEVGWADTTLYWVDQELDIRNTQ